MRINSQPAAKEILTHLKTVNKLGDIRQLAKTLSKNHALGLALWESGGFYARMLAILIYDHKQITPTFIEAQLSDMQQHLPSERTQLVDWLMANQLTKNKNCLDFIENCMSHELALLRRVFWYHQGRLRWMGKQAPTNSAALLTIIEKNILTETPEVQWAMNFTAGWIGIFEKEHRQRCIALGESTALFKNEKVSKGCTPNYLPEFIRIEAGKRNL